MTTTPITVAHGDGIGPEIMDATLFILEEAGAALELERIKVGKELYLSGNTAGIDEAGWESVRRTRVLLKAPITTPQGGGMKSLNVTLRKTLGLFANVRPCVSYAPILPTMHPGMDTVIVRENEEDLYAGIEHRHTDEVMQSIKFISRPGTERIVRYAFEYARAYGRKKVTCMAKDNIMKLSDGLFHRVFDEIAVEYPEFETDFWIVDIGAARLATRPQNFDVVVLPNLYGDILSDVTAELVGSVGLGGSSNVGQSAAMFEAIHGSAPDIAGQGIANPSGLLLGAVMMLQHIGQGDVAKRVHDAWLATLESGVHTGDIRSSVEGDRVVGTMEFAKAVVANLGKAPDALAEKRIEAAKKPLSIPDAPAPPRGEKALVGVDVFVHFSERDANALAERVQACNGGGLELAAISNRGVKVWPNGLPETFCTDHYACRFRATDGTVSHKQIIALLDRFADAGLDFIKTEHLCTFDGERSYSLGQGA